MLSKSKDELGHFKFRLEELHDPVSVITKKVRGEDGDIKEIFLARGEDGKIYDSISSLAKEKQTYVSVVRSRINKGIYKEINKR